MPDGQKRTPMTKNSAEQSAQSLCLACGLCCDGTIFSQVTLKPEDDVAPLEANGVHILIDGNARVFKQPCAAHKNCVCTAYADRPHNCRSYQCKLLKQFKENEISIDEALRIIRIAVAKIAEVKRQLMAASSDNEECLDELTARLKNWLRNPNLAAKAKRHTHLFLNFVALQVCLDRFFRRKPFLQSLTPDSSEK